MLFSGCGQWRRPLEMPAADPYNDVVRGCFADPAHAGDVAERMLYSVSVQASDPTGAVRLQLSAALGDGLLQQVRFRARGCPHVIAGCELLCTELEGAAADRMPRPDAAELMERLSAPRSKTGRFLIIEDALDKLRDAVIKGG